MKHSIEKLKGFGIGLVMAGIGMISSGATGAAQGLCAGSCQACYACGVTAIPLLLWMALKARRHGSRLSLVNVKPRERVAAESLTQIS